MSKRKLTVEGWRFLSHSYAIVNQWQLLAFLRRPDLDLRFVDLPFYQQHWRPLTDLFDAEDTAALRALAPPEPDFRPETTLRIAYPCDVTPVSVGRTLVFGTSELQVIPNSQIRGVPTAKDLAKVTDITLVTPSNWSAEGFRKLGMPDERIVIVPHGVNTALFKPDPEVRARGRARLNLHGFVFFSAGAMSWNKNVEALLKAFAVVAEKVPDARLLLKGDDGLFFSNELLAKFVNNLPPEQLALINSRVVYTGSTVSMDMMAEFFQAADAYVSAYRAEGFNMPVLEAAAAGLPIICTRGGASDDFVTDAFARRIDATPQYIMHEGEVGTYLDANVDHLIALMLAMIDDHDWRAAAAKAGPAHVEANYTWDKVADRLVATAFPD